jgi:hypothetical protein
VFLNLNAARPGLIMFGARVVRCETYELSMDSAVLAVANPPDLPNAFNLVVPCVGMVLNCRVPQASRQMIQRSRQIFLCLGALCRIKLNLAAFITR